MKRKNLTNLNNITFMIMCCVIIVCALVTMNSKIKMNQFMNSYSSKYEDLVQQLNSLQDENKNLSAEILKLSATTLSASTSTDATSEDIPVASTNTTTKDTSTTVKTAIPAESNDSVSSTTTSSNPVEVTATINTTDITSKSNLTADQFNKIIEAVFVKYGYGYDSSSAMYNIGEYLVQMEQQTNVNGLFALSVGSLESGYGSSKLALKKHNLFGISGGSGYRSFDSVNDCIQYFGKLISNNYIANGRTTAKKIGSKYCPGNASKWAGDVNWFMKIYTEAVASL